MAAWAVAEAGPWGKGYEQYPAPGRRGGPDAIRFYFRDRAVRDRFLAEGVPAGIEAEPEDRPALEGRAGRP
ncbi:MAG: hypothetical protein KF765_12270 [Parvibaculaceae bacterium]|nr:hypothetical protein [Parvibaculaceae bacterium]